MSPVGSAGLIRLKARDPSAATEHAVREVVVSASSEHQCRPGRNPKSSTTMPASGLLASPDISGLSGLVPCRPRSYGRAPPASATGNRSLWLIDCVFGVRRNGTGRSPQIARASCPVARTGAARPPQRPMASANRGSNADARHCNSNGSDRTPSGHATVSGIRFRSAARRAAGH
jgi:hypothetical protein